jgi:3',5'-cyclic AMP phosphodiesterase CpdA
VAYVLAQLTDTHVGGPAAGSGERLSLAIETINEMTRRPDRVLLTGDLTHDSTPEQWTEFQERLSALEVPWTAIPGNHDQTIEELAGHRAFDDGPLRFVLVDSANEEFDADDAEWLDHTLAGRPDDRTVVAIHHPPFETGIWWMDRLGMKGQRSFESVVRRHPQVEHVLCGHVHRPIQTRWASCTVWVCPSTAVSIAIDLDQRHSPAESVEPPSFSLHAYTDNGIVSHIVPVGPAADRTLIETRAPDFIAWLGTLEADDESTLS